MSRWPSSAFVDHGRKILERIEGARQYPPRNPPVRPPEGQDFASMIVKHGRPIGVFEPARKLRYRGGGDR
jgi:hypothetical protein